MPRRRPTRPSRHSSRPTRAAKPTTGPSSFGPATAATTTIAGPPRDACRRDRPVSALSGTDIDRKPALPRATPSSAPHHAFFNFFSYSFFFFSYSFSFFFYHYFFFCYFFFYLCLFCTFYVCCFCVCYFCVYYFLVYYFLVYYL